MTWDTFLTSSVSLTHSKAESLRFGFEVERAVVGIEAPEGEDAVRELSRVLQSSRADLVIVRWPSALVTLGTALAAGSRVVIPCDTLVYWECDPGGLVELEHTNDVTVNLLGPTGSASPAVAEVVRSSFVGYRNHYASNPMIDPASALEGYVDWATTSLGASGDALVLWRDGRPLAVATISAGSRGADLEILLAGVVPSAQGQGLYREILRAVGLEAVRREARRVIISTQAQNARVQRAWARAGFVPFAAIATAHAVTPAALVRHTGASLTPPG